LDYKTNSFTRGVLLPLPPNVPPIIYSQALTLKEEMLIDAEITLILESDNVDVVNLNKARVDISYHVLAMGKIIYERD